MHCPARLEGLFRDLPLTYVNELSSYKSTFHLKKGDYVFREGSASRGIFCVSAGKIKLWKSGSEGNEVIIRLYKKGDLLGYRSLLTHQPYGATAQAIEETMVCQIDKKAFTHVLEKEPTLMFKILQRLGRDLAAAESRIRDLSNKSVRQRLGETILSLAKAHGTRSAEGTLVDAPLSRMDLASMVSATPETVIRTLSDFKRQGCLLLQGKKIIIKDVAMLADHAGLPE